MKFVSTQKIYPQLPNNINDYQLDIWNSFLNLGVGINERFKNPTRQDSHAGAILRESNGYIRLFDPPSPYHNKTIFEVIMIKYNCTYVESLKIGYFDIIRGKITHKKLNVPKIKRRCKIRFERRNWDSLDQSFWNGKTNITSSQLESELTFPIDKYSFTDSGGVWINKTPTSNTYHTTVKDKHKIYAPKERLFKTNMDASCIGGLAPFEFELGQPKILILTMNQKSFLCNTNLGYNSRFLPHEGIHIPVNIMKEWDNTFDVILSIMDNDLSGLLANNLMWADWKKHIGNDKFIEASFPKVQDNYITAFGVTKEVSDSYDYTKCYNLKRLDQEIQELLFTNL